MTDTSRDSSGSGLRWAIAVFVTLVMLGATGGAVYWHLYRPRHPSLAAAIEAGDVRDVARFARSRPHLLNVYSFGIDELNAHLVDPSASGIDYWGMRYRAGDLSPLAWAIACDRPDAAEALLRFGADPDARLSDGFHSPFEAVIALDPSPSDEPFTGDIEPMRRRVHRWAKLLIEHGAEVSRPGPPSDKATPLMIALARGDGELIDLLLERGADASIGDARGMTPLMIAVLAGRFDLAERFLSHGGEVNRRIVRSDEAGAGGEYALIHMAVTQRAPHGVVNWLLDHGADADAPCRLPYFGGLFMADNAAHIAWHFGDWETLALLSSRGCALPASAVNAWGQTPLHGAVMRRDRAVARRLLDAGADPLAADTAGQTPADLAATIDDTEMRSMIERAVADRDGEPEASP